MVRFDESSHERDIELPVGETFEISLAENPTTGFRWHVVSNGEPACKLLSNAFVAGGHQPGRPGSHSWQFETTQVGHGSIELVYRRSWEQEQVAARKFTLHIYTYAKEQ